jgi:acyl-CoA dehydrogenase
MTSFQLTRPQQELQAEFRGLAVKCFRPFAGTADKLADLPPGFLEQPPIVVLTHALLPPELGGGWLASTGRHDLSDPFLRLILNEEMGYGDAPLFAALPGLGLAMPILQAFGTPSQKQRVFAPFLDQSRHCWAAFAMSEPSAGSDVSALSTSARKEKDSYVLNGTKWFIGNGLRADWVVVFATINPRLGRFGIRTFLVERGTPEFEASCCLPTMGFRALQISQLKFQECRIPESNLLRTHDTKAGFDGGIMTFQQFRPTVAAMALGTARAALEQASELVQQNGARHSAARRWQNIRENLDFFKLRLRVARLLCWSTARLKINGKDNFAQVCMAKAFCAELVMEICAFAMDVAGVCAVTPDSSLERFFRNAKAFDLLEGTGDMQRLMLTKHLLRVSEPNEALID